MKNIFFSLLFLFFYQNSVAQKTTNKPKNIPMNAENWEFKQGEVEFTTYKGQKTMKILPNAGIIALKDILFTDGTIEFDVEPILPNFAQSIYFRRKDEKEKEIVYLRLGKIGDPLANEGIQYCPYFDGINMWDMYPEYQAPAPIKGNDWNHLKLVISGKQMRVYMNYLPHPILEIPKLEGNFSEGSIAFEGSSYISNLVIKPNETENLSPVEAVDLTRHESNYLRKWAITEPVLLPNGSEVSTAHLPKAPLFTDSIVAERRGMINLTRKFGANPQRKVVWLKTTLNMKETQKTNLQLGFSDEIWVFLNNQMVLVDKNLFQQRMNKYPKGRISIQNTEVKLNLRQGENEILVAVANDFYGWGLMARLEYMDGVESMDEISTILEKAKVLTNIDLEPYLGVYGNGQLPFKITFTKKDKSLFAQVTGQETVELAAAGNHVFRFDPEGVSFEFKPGEKMVIFKQGSENRSLVKE